MYNFKNKKAKLLIFTSVVVILTISITSFYYNVSFSYVIKIGMRKIVLELINVAVQVYDPSKTIEAVSGKELSYVNDIDSYQQGEDNLLKILKEMSVTEGNALIKSYNNPYIIENNHEFGYEVYMESRKEEMDAIYNIEADLVTLNDFKAIIEIRNFVKGLWKHGGDLGFNPDRFDALKIISNAKEGKEYWCHVYALTYSQLLSSKGITSRLVSLSRDGYEKDHAVVEVWSNYYKKWIIMDVDYNLHYVYVGSEIPLNTVELHNAYINNEIDEIEVVKGIPRPVDYDVESKSDYKLLEFYAYVFIDMRNDWYVNDYMRGHPNASDFATLFWFDNRLPRVLNLYRKVSDINDYYWTLNQTEIYFRRIDDSTLELLLKTVTPNFKSWVVTVDGSNEFELDKQIYDWKLHKGYNSFNVKSLNLYGVDGIESTISIYLDNI